MLNYEAFEILTFDCYGTLIDWESGILTAAQPIFAAHGVTVDDETLLAAFGELEAEAELPPHKTYREVLNIVMGGLGERFGFVPTDAERAAFAGSVGDWQPFPDTVEALHKLKAVKKLAILSNVDDDLFAGSAKQLQVAFDFVITAQQIGSYKPSLRNFEVLLERIDIPKERVLHCAQSLFHDIKPAREIGLTTVWVNRRMGKTGGGATPPQAATPDHEVPDLATLAREIAG